ncbi:hypothetical protein OPQ81_005958 [Rhizoctonia solani]|nr:hypothetical protein OPQ81_005958 [Rhizoctonia solani]
MHHMTCEDRPDPRMQPIKIQTDNNNGVGAVLNRRSAPIAPPALPPGSCTKLPATLQANRSLLSRDNFPESSWQNAMMSNSKTITNLESSLYPSNADRRSVGMMGFDVAPSVLAVCRIEGAESDLHYYNTTFSGGAGWRF